MTANEKELITLIRDHSDPEQAFQIALELMLCFSKSHEVPQGTSSVTPQATA